MHLDPFRPRQRCHLTVLRRVDRRLMAEPPELSRYGQRVALGPSECSEPLVGQQNAQSESLSAEILVDPPVPPHMIDFS